MRNSTILFLVLCLLASCQSTKPSSSSLSDNSVLVSVGPASVSSGEFEYAYLKNNHLDKEKTDTREDIEAYLELYKNFKLKVVEAQSLGRDDTEEFKTEFETYERQLAEPYLAMSKVSDVTMKESYERMKEEVRASHILIRLKEQPSPEDTLAAWDKVVEIRKRIIEGADFAEVAKKESQDPSASRNSGDLGYFTAMQMVLPFEIAAFNTPKGEVSQPVRTRFGYHLINVVDRIPTRDQVKVAHIMLTHNEEDSSKAYTKILSIHEELGQGESWSTLCQSFSQDQYTKNKGGELPFIRPGRIDPDFQKAAFELTEIGSYSEPVKTRYGWHIIKLIEKKGAVDSYDEVKVQIEQNLSRYGKYLNKERSAVELLKKENSYEMRDEALSACKAKILNSADSSKTDGVIFLFDGVASKCGEFEAYVKKKKPFVKLSPAELTESYEEFENEVILAYEKDVLLQKNKDYKYLRQEYRDGILLFSIMEDSVWNKASSDTTGIKTYYESNKNKYPKPETAVTIHVSTKEKAQLTEILGILNDAVEDTLSLIEEKYNTSDALAVNINNESFEKGENKYLDDKWAVGTVEYIENARFHGIVVTEIQEEGFKPLNDIRGRVISDYQNYVESSWISKLKEKYPITVNQKTMDLLVKKINNGGK